jgi:hypothetical protein
MSARCPRIGQGEAIKHMASPATRIGPYSRRIRLGKLDRRTREGKYVAEKEAALVQHLGGADAVSAAQRILIRRVAIDLLQLELLDVKLCTAEWSDHDARTAGGLRNSVRLALRDLGLSAPPAPVPSLSQHLALRAAERTAAP